VHCLSSTDKRRARKDRVLVKHLRCFIFEDQSNWDRWLPYATFVFNTTPHTSTGFTPHELLFGRKPNIPGLLQRSRSRFDSRSIATGMTRVVSTAAVLRCGKQMEILPHYYFSWIVSFQKQRYTCEMFPLETKQSRGKLLPHSDLRGGECFEGKYPAAGPTTARRITKERRMNSTATRLERGM